MEITREDLQTLKTDLVRELGGRLDRIEARLTDGDRKFENHEVRLALLKGQTDHVESRVEVELQPKVDKLERDGRAAAKVDRMRAGEWPWKAIVGVLTLLTLMMQILVRLAEALISKL